MTFTDTHTHLYDERLIADADQINRAIAAGVTRMYMPNCNSDTIEPMLYLADKWPDNCMAMMGLHPCYVKEDFETELALVAEWLAKRKFYAVGEIGLDYHWDLTFKSQQIAAFEAQIGLAHKYGLPIVIHSRESTGDCIEVVRKLHKGTLKGIFHCFGGSAEEAAAIVELGFHLGIGGVVTYKNSNLTEVLKHVPLSSVVLETDAPYLSPVPFRGKRNESAYIPYIAEKVAGAKGISIEEVASVTNANAASLFEITA
jgi:TatD DNase family protein